MTKICERSDPPISGVYFSELRSLNIGTRENVTVMWSKSRYHLSAALMKLDELFNITRNAYMIKDVKTPPYDVSGPFEFAVGAYRVTRNFMRDAWITLPMFFTQP